MNIKNNIAKIISVIKRNFDVFFLVVIILSTGISIQTYNLYKNQKKETLFVGTLNGSGLAVGRTLIAILENLF